jgi:hypothetical protein
MMTIDEAALAQARTAQERLLELQRDAERARVDYHYEIRRLHAAGGSLREIADALGLSHQRVHQIIEAEGSESTAETVLLRVADQMRKLRSGVGIGGFAKQGREAVASATDHARRRGARDVEARDILQTVLLDRDESIAAIRAAAGVDVAPLEGDVQTAGAPGGRKRLGFAPSARSTLERALREAMALGDRSITREHLLLGVLQVDDPDVDALLQRVGTNREALRNATLAELERRT